MSISLDVSSASDWTYEINDLVWAKMKGFPPWPGKVSEPNESVKTAKKNSRWIFFFGSENYAWIEVTSLKPYHEFKDALCYSCKTQNFKEACKAIELYIEEHGVHYHKADTSNGISESDAEKKFDNLVHNVKANQTKKKMTPGRTSMPNVTGKTIKRKSTTDQNTKLKQKKDRHSSINTDILTNVGLVNNHSPQRKNNTLLDRPEVTLPESIPLVNIGEVTSTIINRKIVPSELRFGFIGLGKIGSGIVKNLLNSGHKVNIWNRTPDKIDKFIEAGAVNQITPSDVMAASDITFCCVTDPVVAKDMVYGNCGVLGEVSKDKAYVEMTGVDPDTSHEIAESILKKGGRFMETMIQGSKLEAEQGNLICLSAGDKSIYDQCESVFGAISKDSYFLGEIGTACKYSMILHTIQAVSLAGLAEGLALTDRAGLCQKTLMEIFQKTSTNSPLLAEKGNAMMENHFTTNHALKLIQKDVCMTVQWSECMEQPCPVSATVNEVFKHSKRLGYSDHDTSSVYVRAKF